jgi:hypothetical protein
VPIRNRVDRLVLRRAARPSLSFDELPDRGLFVKKTHDVSPLCASRQSVIGHAAIVRVIAPITRDRNDARNVDVVHEKRATPEQAPTLPPPFNG